MPKYRTAAILPTPSLPLPPPKHRRCCGASFNPTHRKPQIHRLGRQKEKAQVCGRAARSWPQPWERLQEPGPSQVFAERKTSCNTARETGYDCPQNEDGKGLKCPNTSPVMLLNSDFWPKLWFMVPAAALGAALPWYRLSPHHSAASPGTHGTAEEGCGEGRLHISYKKTPYVKLKWIMKLQELS